MTASRPDLLPFAVPSEIGCPLHGLVIDGGLTLPNSTTITYPAPMIGETHLVRHPRATTPSRTAAEQADDTARGYQWRNYGIMVTGEDDQDVRVICGREIGEHAWLYCDANATWIVSVDLDTVGTTSRTIKVYLENLFGWFSDNDTTMSRRLLVSHEYTPKLYDGSDQAEADNSLARLNFLAHSATGSKTSLNIATQCQFQIFGNPPCYSPWIPADETEPSAQLQTTDSPYYRVAFHNAFLITISGNGSLVPGSIGSGIGATVTSLATAPEMIIDWDNDGYGTEDHIQYECFHTVTQSGTITKYAYERTSVLATPENPSGSRTVTASWGGQTFSVSGVNLGPPNPPTISGKIIHPNVLSIGTYDGSTDLRYLVSVQGDTESIDSTETGDAQTVSWEPGTGTISWEDGKSICYV